MDIPLAYFVTPHGFGHAGRASAVMVEVQRRMPEARFEIFTRVPEWFFSDSGIRQPRHHICDSDVGFVQSGPLEIDLPGTLAGLDAFLPFDPHLVSGLASRLQAAGCRLVVCDISPLGIAAARAAGLPAVLVENFTWDWIYARHPEKNLQLEQHAARLADIFRQADYRIQAEPVCAPGPADLTVAPISRPFRDPQAMVGALGLPPGSRYVLITMGGIPENYTFLENLPASLDTVFVVPGAASTPTRRGSLLLLPHRSGLYLPDLTAAAAAVVGKLGYSTVAEVHHAGVPFGYLHRPQFAESEVLADFVRRQGNCLEISAVDYASGRWEGFLPRLLSLPICKRSTPNGAAQVAEFLIAHIIKPGCGST